MDRGNTATAIFLSSQLINELKLAKIMMPCSRTFKLHSPEPIAQVKLSSICKLDNKSLISYKIQKLFFCIIIIEGCKYVLATAIRILQSCADKKGARSEECK